MFEDADPWTVYWFLFVIFGASMVVGGYVTRWRYDDMTPGFTKWTIRIGFGLTVLGILWLLAALIAGGPIDPATTS